MGKTGAACLTNRDPRGDLTWGILYCMDRLQGGRFSLVVPARGRDHHGCETFSYLVGLSGYFGNPEDGGQMENMVVTEKIHIDELAKTHHALRPHTFTGYRHTEIQAPTAP